MYFKSYSSLYGFVPPTPSLASTIPKSNPDCNKHENELAPTFP